MLWHSVFLNSVGTFLPPRVPLDAIDLNPGGEDAEGRNTFWGIESLSVSDTPAYVMAGLATKHALKYSTHRGETLSPIVYVDPVSYEHLAPASYVQRIVNQPGSFTFKLDAASDGVMAAIEAAAGLLSNSNGVSAALVASGARMAPGQPRSLGGVLMGDGAAALVISKKEGFARLIASNRNSDPAFEFLQRNRATQPGVLDIPVLEIGLGPYLPTISRLVAETVRATLVDAGISIEDISYFCPPTAPETALKEVYLKTCNIPLEKTCWSEMRKNGHVFACDQILGLAHLIDTGQLKQGQLVMLLGGGAAGWRTSCLLLQVVHENVHVTRTLM